MYYKTVWKLLFIILLTIIACEAKSAQEKSVYFFDTSLHINTNVSFDKVRVVDNRLSKENIGYFNTEDEFAFKTTRKSIITKEPFNVEIEKYILNIVSPATKRSNELLLVLYDFMAEDMPKEAGFGTLYIKADVFLGQSNNYKLVGVVDSLQDIIDDNTTPLVWRSISESMYKITSEIASMDPDTLSVENTYSLDAAKNRLSIIKSKLPVYNSRFKEGLYKSYNDFINNSPESIPVIIKNVIVTDKLTKTFMYARKPNGKKGDKLDHKSIYAAYVGSTWYVRFGENLFKAYFDKGDFYVQLRATGGNSYYIPVYLARLNPDGGGFKLVKRIK